MSALRVTVGVLGGLLLIGGLIAAGSGAGVDGWWAAIVGGGIVLAVVFERSRYRSAATEAAPGEPGPGGGEPSLPGAPFRPTEEVFIDPTSGHKLRVYLDPATGERRYYAEGVRPGG